ncbi:MAG TPA: 1-deoxy-D-xylulose-5-phosphate synthase [Ruminococcaceae bacterium]|nr:1-deoxy-D-xylulose-5-phosphate synthase [Oscillospiraceae bacterium]
MREGNLLKRINSPADLKKLNIKQLPALCDEIRETLIAAVSENGGHLASNLGVVELTVAMHFVFDCPRDEIVFDVGHQSYTHKLLTGRQHRFDTLRKENGLSGFPRPTESEYDTFIAGHSSTSISAAFGISRANHYKMKDDYVIAVIGDGALTGGMAYEALNNAGKAGSKLIVILNDNKMSISKNVGAIARYLAVIRSKPSYYAIKNRFIGFFGKIPFIGAGIKSGLERLKRGLKNMMYTSNMFEDMGFSYLGPVDGHDLGKLTTILATAKKMKRPAFVHINTVKGKGYSFAEQNPKQFHGVPAFDIETGDPFCDSQDNFSYQMGQYLCSLAEEDDRICAITAAMTEGTGLQSFKNYFKDRFYDVGIAEEHAVTFACGMSIKGMVPVFAVYSSFLQRGYDQILHDAAIQKCKIVLAVDRAGIVGEDGETHQGVFDAAFLNTIPGVTVFSPANYQELFLSLHLAVYDVDGVAAVRYPRGAQPVLPADYQPSESPFSLYGSRSGTAIITYGRLFAHACEAARELEEKDTPVQIVKLNRIKPLPDSLFDMLMDYDKLFFFEEGIRSGGIAEHTAAKLLQKGYKGSYHITAIDDRFIPQAPSDVILRRFKLDARGMTEVILESKSR